MYFRVLVFDPDHGKVIILWQNQINYILIETQNHGARHRNILSQTDWQRAPHWSWAGRERRGDDFLIRELRDYWEWWDSSSVTSHIQPRGCGQLQTKRQLFRHPRVSSIKHFEVYKDLWYFEDLTKKQALRVLGLTSLYNVIVGWQNFSIPLNFMKSLKMSCFE